MFAIWAEFLTVENPPTANYRGCFLNSAALDYSVDSLRHVDDYLELVRRQGYQPSEVFTVVTRCGAYLGEVIRRASPASCRWIAYEDALRTDCSFGRSPESMENFALLRLQGKFSCLPFSKVIKRLHLGKEDSVETFAKLIITLQQLPKDQFDKFWCDLRSKFPDRKSLTFTVMDWPRKGS